jgi:hypothetical protein
MRRRPGSRWSIPIPERIGDPSKIKHVFLIIRENRTYDQILGDVAAGNGDPSLAVFGDNNTVTGQVGPVTPNAHALVERFPLFDNFYDPSRQSADGHNARHGRTVGSCGAREPNPRPLRAIDCDGGQTWITIPGHERYGCCWYAADS